MTSRRTLFALTAAFSLTAAAPALAQAPWQRDHDSIVGMAGDYKVRFDMRETVSFVPSYKVLEPKVSGGYEAVRVIEDRGTFVSLQHLLVVEDDGKPVVVKHWRQDWTWQPKDVLVYQAANRWTKVPVTAAAGKGAWSQTVWQTDDSPRYGGVGRWAYDNGVARWTSDATLRPLARRDAVRHPVYTWYVGQNRHALTPVGWIHEQDNAKVGVLEGKPVTYAHEVVLNSYTKAADLPVAPADVYWGKTKDYWAAVRLAWEEAAKRHASLAVREEAQNGSMTGPRLMGLADEIAEGKTTTAAAIVEARAVIAKETSASPAG